MSSKWLSKALRHKIEQRDQMQCCYCGKHCERYNQRSNNYDYATLDHIVPRIELFKVSQDYDTFLKLLKDVTLLVVVCNACNSSKQHKTLFEWAMEKGLNYPVLLAEITRRISIPLYT